MRLLNHRLLIMVVFLLAAPAVWAQKVNFDFGMYTIKATPPTGSTGTDITLSSPGAYSLSANFEIKQPFEIGVGYTVFFSKILSGDMGFGPDFYLYYFPFSEGSAVRVDTPAVQYREIQQWRPYGYMSFHQRQFQSAQSSYSGFGFGLGTEYQYTERLGLRGSVRQMTLAGPATAQFNYMDILLGIQLQF